jgi:hypothetical protein
MQDGPFEIFRPSHPVVIEDSQGTPAIEDPSVKSPLDPKIILFAPHMRVRPDLEELRVTLFDAAPGSRKLAEAAYLNMRSETFLLISKPDRQYDFALDQIASSFARRQRVPAILALHEYTVPADAARPMFVVEGSRYSKFPILLAEQLGNNMRDDVVRFNFHGRLPHQDMIQPVAMGRVPGMRDPDAVAKIGDKHGAHWARLYLRSDIIADPIISTRVVVAAIETTLRHPAMVADMQLRNEVHFPQPRKTQAAPPPRVTSVQPALV